MAGELLALVGAFCYAVCVIIVKRAIKDIPAQKGLFIEFVLITVLFFSIIVLSKQWEGLIISYLGILYFVLSSISAFVLGRVFMYRCLELLGASRTSLYQSTQTLFTALLALVLFKEILSLINYVGMALVFLGVWLLTTEITSSGNSVDQLPKKRNHLGISFQNISEIKGVLFGLGCGLFFGLGNIFRKLGLDVFPSVIIGSFISAVTVVIILGLYFLYLGELGSFNIYYREKKPSMLLYMYSGIFTAVAIFVLTRAITLSPVTVVQTLKSTIPFFVLILSVIFLKEEKINRITILSTVTIFVGVVLLLL